MSDAQRPAKVSGDRSQAYSDTERKKAERHKRTRSYKRAVDRTREERKARERTRRALVRARRDYALDRLDTDTHVGPLNLEAELEGRGGIAKAAEFAKRHVAGTELGRTGLRAAGVPLPEGKLGEYAAKDLIDIPAQAIPSAYATGAAAKEALQGRPQRGKRLWKDFTEHDPLALAAQGKFDRAAKEAEKHPVLTALSVSGAGSAISRGAGIGVRASGAALRHAPSKTARTAGRTLRRVGSTKRAPKVAPGTPIQEQRSYSSGLAGKAAQVAVERVQTKRARRVRRKARATSDPQRRAQLQQQAAELHPRILSERELARRVDEREAMAEVRRRTHRARALKETDEALPKDVADMALLVAQGAARPTRASLRRLIADLDDQARSGNLSRSQRQANRKLAKQVRAALADKKLNLDKIERAAAAYAKVVGPRQKGLVSRGILAPERERMAKLIPYAVREMDARWDSKADRLERDGEPLTAETIETHMRTNEVDPDEVAYVTQAPGQRGARNFFMSWHEPKGIRTGKRTGEATRKGTFEINREVGRENVARTQGLLDAHDEYVGFLSENAYRPRGRKIRAFVNHRQADRFARDELADSPYEWRAVPTRPLFGRKQQTESLLDTADAQDVGVNQQLQRGIQAALEGDGDGPFVLIPVAAAERLHGHSRLLGSKGTKVTRKLGRQFSGTVLTTTGLSWPTGNVVEASLRNAIARAGPGSLALGRKTIAKLRELDPALADELEARIGTGHLGAYELNNVHATADMFRGTRFAPAARAIGTFARAPGPKQLAKLWDGWTKTIFAGNGFIEHQFRVALLGRHLRSQGYSPAKLAASEGTRALSVAAEQAAKGLTGTNEQVAAARFIRRAYGQYEAWSPEMRWTIAVFTPFVAWSLNAVRFVGSVLPRDHPVLTGLLASAERASEEWRESFGLGRFVEGAAPNWMQASIPADGKLVPVGRYTPFGFFSDPLEQGGSLILPQAKGALLATLGLDWKGDPIAGNERGGDATEAQRAKEMARVIAGATVPFFALQERLRDKGTSALNPARGYPHNPKLSAASDQLDRIEAEQQHIRDTERRNGQRVDADNPTRRYTRLLEQGRTLNARIHRLSNGQYGRAPAKPDSPRASFEEFKHRRRTTVRDDFETYKQKAKGNDVRKAFDEYVNGR